MSSVASNWVLSISTSVAVISVAFSSWLALREYRLKLKAEERLQQSSQAETEIRLLKLFTEIMKIAHGRSGYTLSEKAVEQLFYKGAITKTDLDNLEEEEPKKGKKIKKKLTSAALLTLPVGSAAQDAAIAAVFTLTKDHEVLKDVGLQGLKSLHASIPSKRKIIEKYLNMLKEGTT